MGEGADLVMLHGWSMNSTVWDQLAERLATCFTLHLVDLPGHGQSDWQQGALDWDVLLNNLANELPQTAYYVGWSLGGLISIAFAERYPQRVKKLVLLAATPCFVQQQDWLYAMDESVFNAFSVHLSKDQAGTLQRFLLLQARGSHHSRDTINTLAEKLSVDNPPHAEALKAGLALLIETDKRKALSTLSCPIHAILGDRDTLIPKAVLHDLEQLNAQVETTLLAGGGHAPFISQATECQHAIEQFLND